MTAASTTTASTAVSVPDGGRGRGEREALRQEVGPLRHTPGDDGGGDRDQGEPRAPRAASRTSSTRAPTPQAPLRISTGKARGETVEQVGGIGAQHEGADDGDHGHDDGGDNCSAAEVLGHVRLVQASGVPHEIDRRQVGNRGDGQDPTDDGGRVDPAVHRIPRLAAGRHSSRRDPAHDRSHAVRHQHRGEGERPPKRRRSAS